jgi:hypothetical protein
LACETRIGRSLPSLSSIIRWDIISSRFYNRCRLRGHGSARMGRNILSVFISGLSLMLQLFDLLRLQLVAVSPSLFREFGVTSSSLIWRSSIT